MSPVDDSLSRLKIERFYESLRKLAGTLDLQILSSSFRQLVGEALPLDGFVVSMLSPDREFIRCAYLWAGGDELDAAALPPIPYEPDGTGMQTEVFRTGRPKIFDVQSFIANQPKSYVHITPDGNSESLEPNEAKRSEVRSILMVPMLLEDQVIGVLQACSHDAEAYSQHDAEVLSALTAPLAVAFQNSVLFDAAKREIQERKVAEEALRESESRYRELSSQLEVRIATRTEALQKAIDELNGFTYSISHDIRAPLRAVISTSRILLEDHGNEFSETARGHLERQVAAGRKMAKLVDDLLEFARHGRQEVERQEVDLSSTFNRVAGLLTQPGWSCEAMRIEVQDGMSCFADPSLVEILATILLDNAGKFRVHGGDGCIQVGRCPEGYFVRDNGIGFDMAYLEKLFQPFTRLHRDQEYPGTGIGLANAKRIAERHGGSMWAASEGPSCGATFYFTLSS